ncbi:MAG: NAD(P)-dependent oxidoreductase [Bryobacteraceae bacterium]
MDDVKALPDVYIINSFGGNAAGVAEYTINLAASLCRKSSLAAGLVDSGRFEHSYVGRITRLEGKVWLLLGAGHQVQCLLAQASMFALKKFIIWHPEMNIEKFRECLSRVPESICHFDANNPLSATLRLPGASTQIIAVPCLKPDLLAKEADIVSVHVPLVRHDVGKRRRTIGLVGPAFLAEMKPTAFLVNVSRGSIVDENAIAERLKAKLLAGYATDVIEAEIRLDPELSPIWSLAITNNRTDPTIRLNLVVSPHIAGVADIDIENVSREVITALLRALRVQQDPVRSIQ